MMMSMLVVPHAGDVDRNAFPSMPIAEAMESSPTRGTWIEIKRLQSEAYRDMRRPPRGGRG